MPGSLRRFWDRFQLQDDNDRQQAENGGRPVSKTEQILRFKPLYITLRGGSLLSCVILSIWAGLANGVTETFHFTLSTVIPLMVSCILWDLGELTWRLIWPGTPSLRMARIVAATELCLAPAALLSLICYLYWAINRRGVFPWEKQWMTPVIFLEVAIILAHILLFLRAYAELAYVRRKHGITSGMVRGFLDDPTDVAEKGCCPNCHGRLPKEIKDDADEDEEQQKDKSNMDPPTELPESEFDQNQKYMITPEQMMLRDEKYEKYAGTPEYKQNSI